MFPLTLSVLIIGMIKGFPRIPAIKDCCTRGNIHSSNVPGLEFRVWGLGFSRLRLLHHVQVKLDGLPA